MMIGSRKIAPNHPPYIIAELSGNHNGNIENVYKLIDEAALAGADAVKLQTYTPDTITMNSDRPDFIVKDGPWKGRKLYDLYTEAHTPYAWHGPIFNYARNVRSLEVFSSVFDESAVDLLEGIHCSAYKIASFELTDLPLIKYAASTKKPMIISTGMGSYEEIIAAVNTYNKVSGKPDNLALLHCVSAYPTSPSQANLPALGPLSELAGGKHVVGLSDHSLGLGVAVASVAFGATIIEKHLTLDRSGGGPDSGFSLEPHEFAATVRACREAWEATRASISVSQEASKAFRRSVYVVKPIAAGERLTTENVRVIRPAYGLQPRFYPYVLGQVAQVDLKAGSPLSLDHLVASDE